MYNSTHNTEKTQNLILHQYKLTIKRKLQLESIIEPEGGTKKDTYSSLGKIRGVFRKKKTLRSEQYSTNTKFKLYQICVTPALLY